VHKSRGWDVPSCTSTYKMDEICGMQAAKA
jgi:hypothetical protein